MGTIKFNSTEKIHWEEKMVASRGEAFHWIEGSHSGIKLRNHYFYHGEKPTSRLGKFFFEWKKRRAKKKMIKLFNEMRNNEIAIDCDLIK